MTKIIAPNKEYTGLSAGVYFCNGVGETDNPNLIEWFEKHGYHVEGNEKDEQESVGQGSEESETVEPEEIPEPKKAGRKKAGE